MLWRLPTGAYPTHGRPAQEAGVSNTLFPLRPQQEEVRDKNRANLRAAGLNYYPDSGAGSV